MIYLLNVDLDYSQITEPLEEIFPREWEQTTSMVASGKMLGIWRKANAKGVVAIWNMDSHEEVMEQIRKMPLYKYMSKIDLEPLVAHPRFPQFCDPLLLNEVAD